MSLTSVDTNPVTEFGNLREEFSAITSGCAVCDLEWRAKISVTGEDRTRWLNGMVTNNIRDLAIGHGVYAFQLNPQGHILGDLYAYNRGDFLTLDTGQPQVKTLISTFDHYIIMDDVQVKDASQELAAIGVVGPNSIETLRAAKFDVPELEPLQLADLDWNGSTVTLVRTDMPGVPEYELWYSPANSPQIHGALIKAGAKPVRAAALELLRVAQGVPRYGQDIRERDLPQETGQQRALHFSKGCYIGQEIVERIRSRGSVHRAFVGFGIDGPLPAPGTRIQADGKEVGEITSVVEIPTESTKRAVALGYIRRDFAAPGTIVQAGSARLSIESLPFAG